MLLLLMYLPQVYEKVALPLYEVAKQCDGSVIRRIFRRDKGPDESTVSLFRGGIVTLPNV